MALNQPTCRSRRPGPTDGVTPIGLSASRIGRSVLVGESYDQHSQKGKSECCVESDRVFIGALIGGV
jgi:hypothetical protein